jgi:hypothetical protein
MDEERGDGTQEWRPNHSLAPERGFTGLER